MIRKAENRELTKEEFDYLVENTWDEDVQFNTEKRFDYFKNNAVEQFGILINNRPIYFGALVKGDNEKYEIWTIPVSGLKQQFSLFKIAKKMAKEWANKYGKIYAYVKKNNTKILEWSKRMGFEVIKEDDLITLCLSGG